MLCFVDVETTGVNPFDREIIEVAAIKDGEVFERRFKPFGLCDPGAAKVNGYNPETWGGKQAQREDWIDFNNFIDGCYMVGHNVSFDRMFLQATFHHFGIPDFKCKHTWICTQAMAWPLFTDGNIKRMSLAAVCEFFCIPPEPAIHSALNGALACQQVYNALLGKTVERLHYS